MAEHLAATRTRIAELRWREAALRALDGGSDPERLRRLRLPARIQHLPTATADFARAWERVLPASVPRRLAAAILDQAVPEPPGAPTPATVLAYAELHALVAEPQFLAYWAAPHVRDKASLYAALLDASEGAAPAVAAGRAPHDCAALRAFTAACARARGTDDTPGFRARMAAEFRGTVPLFRRYRQHVRTVTAATGPSPGTPHCWLVEALIAEHGPRP
ncbi:hypothetical protein MUU72_04700 [Streptomyces sp. RS10V-4]|uniref:hypothetical protein n=1 Tax=Streptomyces rhizoryzae TaxID=2932493 RepID=UPI002005A64D|nr:hypothetical protein [Streptomyces rhizoryzae]MCK7622421.1 hypothetical protein [Streptomyces rhizoryzae]